MIRIKVELGPRSYPVNLGYDTFQHLGEMADSCGLGKRVVLITDTNVERIYKRYLLEVLTKDFSVLDFIAIPAGEKSKSFQIAENVLSQLFTNGSDRGLTILAVGGGVVGDLAGFVASIYKRGVSYVQVPTTLLAQVDSSIGGKTGINHATGKNLIGTIYQPRLVCIDSRFLETLPKREIVCGIGEIVKYGIIKAPKIFGLCETELKRLLQIDRDVTTDVIAQCCEIKAGIVSRDERENGLRMILNLGHTVGHGIEAALSYHDISHGEAVLIGILAESHIALQLKMISEPDFNRIASLVEAFDFNRKLKVLEAETVFKYMKSDKKIRNDRMRFVLPRKIGEVEVVEKVDNEYIQNSLSYIMELFS